MAIFGHFGKDPNPIPETITQIYGDGITGFDKASMRRLHEWVQSPCCYGNAGELNNILNKIIPNPHFMTQTFFQYVGNSIKYQSQEYFVVRERR
jgi:hypothetical protein